MKCIILAAGYATRMYPLTENFPKPLLEVGGRPIVDWLIADIGSVVDEIVVVTNHKFAGHFNEWAKGNGITAGKKIRVIDDGTETNETRLGAVRDIALGVETAGEDDYLVMAGDNVLTFSLVPFVEFARGVGTSCVMCHEERELAKLRKTAVITIDEKQVITSYEEKPIEPRGHLAVPPFYYYRANDTGRIQEAIEDRISADAPGSFAAWLSGKVKMHAWRMTGERFDIGSLEQYEKIRGAFRSLP